MIILPLKKVGGKMAEKKLRKKYPLKKHVRNIAVIIFGTFLDCTGYLIFIQPNDLLAGGVWGVAGILNHFIAMIPMGAFVAVLNIPLLLWGWRKLNLRFALYTIFAILLQSVMLVFLMPYLPSYADNPLLACIFGGVIMGIGSGLVVKFHGSGGGTDIVGIILHAKYDISVGSISLAVKVLIVTLAAFIFGFEPAMYTMVSMFISTMVFSQVLEGINRKRNMMIITSKGHLIAERLMFEIGRGVTIMKGEGGYTHQERDVLFCVVSRFELPAIKELVYDCDPHAFVCINQAYEVLGKFPRKAQPDLIKPEDFNDGKPEPDEFGAAVRPTIRRKVE
jgi:uncharacterized membrane-anchored protein YitT (DUF2179 family)